MANICKTCKHYEVKADDEPCVSCRFRDYDVPTKWENPFKQKTNADSIRAMTDEELAKHLYDIGWDCHLCAEYKRLDNEPLLRGEKCDEKCVENCLEWLKQPAEKEEIPQGDK